MCVCVTEKLRRNRKSILQQLLNMSNLKILNTKAYADSVAKKKIRTKSISAPKASYKQLCRKQQRKLCTQKKQLKRLRVQNKDLKKEVKDLKEIVQRLLQGDHDIDLDGGSQADMEKLLLQWNSNEAALRTEINLQDSTGTLDLFWREQLERQSDPKKKKQWNPIVLRYFAHVAPHH